MGPSTDAPAVRPTVHRLLVLATALAVTLGVQLAGPSVATAATGPTVVDGGGTVSVSVYEVVLPGAQDDLAGSAAIKRGLTVFTATQPAPLPAGSSVADKVLYDSGFGTWKIAGDGRMTFDTNGVTTGTRSVRYRITDAAGLTAEGLQTVVVTAGAGDDSFATTQGRSVTLDLLANDRPGRDADGSPGTIDRASLRWRAAQGAPVTVSADGLVLTFPRVGLFTIDPTTRLATFAPDVAYTTDDSYALYYTAQDTTRTAAGGVEHHAITARVRWTVTADQLTLTETVSPDLFFHVGDTITWTATITNAGATPVAGLALTHSLGARILTQTCTPVALGGTLPARTSTTCTATARARQQDFDAEAATISDTVVATGTTTQGGQTLPLRVQSGSSTASRITQGITLTGAATPTSVTAPGQRVDYTFVVRNRGNRSVRDLVVGASSPGVSALVCSPVALGGTLGDNRSTTCRATRTVTGADLATPTLTATAKATAVPVSGFHATAANAVSTVRTTVADPTTPPTPPPPAGSPVARPDSSTTAVGRPVVVDVLANDVAAGSSVPLVGSSVRLRTSPDLPAGSVLYGDAKTLKVAGRGVFLVSGTGQVTFVPLGTTTGPVPTVGYQVADAAGTTTRATLSVTVR